MATNQAATQSVSEFPPLGKHPQKKAAFTIGQPFSPYGMFAGAFIPEGVCRYPGLKPGAKLALGRLYRFSGKDGRAFPAMETLGREIGLGLKQTRRYVHQLEAEGFLRCDRPDGKTSHYVFLWHPAYEGELEAVRMDGPPLPDQGGVGLPDQGGVGTPGSRGSVLKESHLKNSVGRSVPEPKGDGLTDNSLDLIGRAIEETGICAKVRDIPSRALLERIAVILNGRGPLDSLLNALQDRIRLRSGAVTGLGVLEGLARDVAASAGMPAAPPARGKLPLGRSWAERPCGCGCDQLTRHGMCVLCGRSPEAARREFERDRAA